MDKFNNKLMGCEITYMRCKERMKYITVNKYSTTTVLTLQLYNIFGIEDIVLAIILKILRLWQKLMTRMSQLKYQVSISKIHLTNRFANFRADICHV